MIKEWIIVELLSVLVENLASLYFLNSRYNSKYNVYKSQLGIWGVFILCSCAAGISSINLHAFVVYSLMLTYLLVFKYGSILQKIFGVLVVCSIHIGTSIIGAGVAAAIESTTIKHTLVYQDTSRLLAILFIKMMQVVVFYILSKNHAEVRKMQKRPVWVLSAAAIIDFAYLFIIRMYVESPDLNIRQNKLLVWISVGALIIMVVIFLIYELFIREEIKNLELAMKLQRSELESSFFKEMDHVYSGIRNWQHDYKNNLNALRALVDKTETKKALDFIDNMYGETYKNKIMMQTGNIVLDATVSSKLRLAQLKKIEVNIQAIYPENNHISDNDLCTIVGNLIDNSIEACDRMKGINEKKFINLLILPKKKNLFISISNSYNNEVNLMGNRYLTVKKEPFHGIGILHVDSIITKYQGHVLRAQKNGVFETQIMLPLLTIEEVNEENGEK